MTVSKYTLLKFKIFHIGRNFRAYKKLSIQMLDGSRRLRRNLLAIACTIIAVQYLKVDLDNLALWGATAKGLNTGIALLFLMVALSYHALTYSLELFSYVANAREAIRADDQKNGLYEENPGPDPYEDRPPDDFAELREEDKNRYQGRMYLASGLKFWISDVLFPLALTIMAVVAFCVMDGVAAKSSSTAVNIVCQHCHAQAQPMCHPLPDMPRHFRCRNIPEFSH